MKMIGVSLVLLTTAFLSGCMSTSPKSAFLPLASGVNINVRVDGGLDLASSVFIAENVEIMPAEDESGITHYRMYWGDVFGEIKGGMIASLQARHDGKVLSYRFPTDTLIQKNADYIIICSANSEVSYCGPSFNVEARVASKIASVDLLALTE